MVKRFDSELAGDAKVIATGGLADVIQTQDKVFDIINPDLTLTGLRIIYDLNQ